MMSLTETRKFELPSFARMPADLIGGPGAGGLPVPPGRG